VKSRFNGVTADYRAYHDTSSPQLDSAGPGVGDAVAPPREVNAIGFVVVVLEAAARRRDEQTAHLGMLGRARRIVQPVGSVWLDMKNASPISPLTCEFERWSDDIIAFGARLGSDQPGLGERAPRSTRELTDYFRALVGDSAGDPMTRC